MTSFDARTALNQLEEIGVITNSVELNAGYVRVLFANGAQHDLRPSDVEPAWLSALAVFTALAKRFKLTYEDGPAERDVQELVQCIREMQ